jgi:streptogramin lyase
LEALAARSALAGVLLAVGVVGSAAASVSEFPVAPGAGPAQIAVGPDQALWFTDRGSSEIGRITTGGALSTPFGGLTAASAPQGIVSAPDGNLWFTEFSNNALGRITPSGTVTEFSLAGLGANRGPAETAVGSNGLLYFTEFNIGRVGRINPLAGNNAAITASETQSAVVPSGPGAQPSGITAGPDGNLWFTEGGPSRVANINPTLTTINEFVSGITPLSDPSGIAVGSDGALWFTEKAGNRIGRSTTGGSVSEFPIPTANSAPSGIALGPDGSLWFTESGSSQIGRIDPVSHAVTEFPLSGTSPEGIVAGPDGGVWFTEPGRDRIGRIPALKRTLSISRVGSGGGVVTSAPSGIDCGATCSAQFDDGSIAALAATPDPGSHFSGWSGAGCSGTGACQVTMNGDQAVTATFDSNPPGTHALTVAKSGTGAVTTADGKIDCGSTCSHVYDDGASVTLNATPAAGSTFAGWGGACSGTSACNLTMGADHDVSATFIGIPNTKITKTKVSSKKRTASFEFKATAGTATGFQCELKRKPHTATFKKCSSPKAYEQLKPGRYVFQVRAIDAAGEDLTPAKKEFAIN